MDLMDYRRKIIANSPHLMSASGAVVSFSDGADLPLKSLNVDIEPIQDLHGYDSPWVGGGGVNKIDYLSCIGIGGRDGTDSIYGNNTSISGNQLTINRSYAQGGGLLKGVGVFPMSTGDKVTISGSVTLTNTERMYVGVGNYDGGGTNGILAVRPSSGKFAVTVTAGSDYAKTGIFLQPESANSSMVVSNVMVALGETEKPYAPYENICPISGWNAVKVTRNGKNLLDDVTPTVVNAYISNLNGVPILRANAENRTVIVQIKENTTYTYTWNQSAKAGASADDSNIILFDEYPVVEVTLGYSTGGNMNSTNNKRTFNSADYKYAAIKIANTSRSNFEETLSASMLEVGSTATAYEPYRGNTWFFGFNKLPPSVATTVTNNGITLTTNGDGTYTLTGQTGSSSAQVSAVLTEEYTFKSDDYIHVGNSVSNPSMSINFDKSSGGAVTYYGPTPVNRIVKVAENVVGQTCGKIRFYIAANTTVNMTFKPMISTLGTAFDFVPYTGTIYGGTLNPLTGVLTVYPYYAAYNGEALTGRWVSDRDKYVAGTTPTIGAQVVDMSGTGAEIQLTPQQVRSLYGNNTIFADTGNVALEYWAHP